MEVGQKSTGQNLLTQNEVLITERAYDLIMSDLLHKCKLAKESGNEEIKSTVLGIIESWKRFFQAEKKLINNLKEDEYKEAVLSFIEDQIKFLDVLAKELK